MSEVSGNGKTAEQVPNNTFLRAVKSALGDGISNLVSHSNDQPRSFSEAVGRSSIINNRARFEFASVGNNDASKSGKTPSASLSPFAIIPNLEMLEEIVKEKDRLRDTAIFFSAIEIDKCPPRKFMDDWFHHYWNNKLGLHISFYRQIHKGLYVILFVNHDAQTEVLKNQYWNVGSTSFRAIAWSPKSIHEEVLTLSTLRWILVKNIPPFLWHFLPYLLEPIGKIIRMDETMRLPLHMDARILISLLQSKDLPNNISINILNDTYICPIEILGGLNSCFLCWKEGHLRKDCPIIREKPNTPNDSTKNMVNPSITNNPPLENALCRSTPASSSSPSPPTKAPNPTNISTNVVPNPLFATIARPENVSTKIVPNPLSANTVQPENFLCDTTPTFGDL